MSKVENIHGELHVLERLIEKWQHVCSYEDVWCSMYYLLQCIVNVANKLAIVTSLWSLKIKILKIKNKCNEFVTSDLSHYI